MESSERVRLGRQTLLRVMDQSQSVVEEIIKKQSEFKISVSWDTYKHSVV